MTPKQFIEVIFLNELKELSSTKAYISFAVMATGIEFLGKCLDSDVDHWNERGKSKINFEDAINKLDALSSYRPFLTSHKLWDSLRNGFSHSFVPKYPLTLSSRNEMAHLTEHSKVRLNLKCEDFYADFERACIEVLNMDFAEQDKMNRELLSVPYRED